MKMVMIAYNEAIDMEVMEVLENCAMKNFTKITGVYGRGTTSGTHLGNDIWQGRNNLLYVACEEKQAKQLLSCVKELIFSNFQIDKLDEHALQAEVRGCNVTHYRRNIEIKAATYHELKITKIKSGWQAEVIFDV